MSRKAGKGRARAQRASFAEILESARPASSHRLGEKARVANQIAKVAPTARSRTAAYRVKTAALEQGIRCERFRLRSDELGRYRLAVVRTEGHGMLHVRVDRLSSDILNRPEVQLHLRGAAA